MKRGAMDFIKQKFGNQLIIGAEVGIEKGFHALDILQNMLNVKLLYLIDPYSEYPPFKDAAKERLSSFSTRVRWVQKEFEVCAVQDVPDLLDFIYINGDHAYEHVKKDILLAAQLVKKEGVIAGHDAGALGVDKAYKEYCQSKNIVYFTGKGSDPDKPFEGWDWWFINEKKGVEELLVSDSNSEKHRVCV